MSTSETVLGRFVCRVANQYPLSEFARQAWPLLTSQGSARLTEGNRPSLSKVLESNPTWTAAFLGVVHHPKLDGARVTDLSASSLKNLDEQLLIGLLYGFSLPSLFFSDFSTDAAQRYWQRTLLRSVGIQLLGKKIDIADRSGLLSAGMVADIGSLVLLRELKQTYVQFVEDAEKHGHDLHQMELDSLGFDHRVLAVRLLDQWSVASQVTRIVGEASGGSTDVTVIGAATPLSVMDGGRAIFQAADFASELMGGRLVAKAAEKKCTQLVKIAKNLFAWNLEQLQTWTNEIVEPAQHLATNFSVQFGTPIEIHEPLARAWNEELASEQNSKTKLNGSKSQQKPNDAGVLGGHMSPGVGSPLSLSVRDSRGNPSSNQLLSSESSDLAPWAGEVGSGNFGSTPANATASYKSEFRGAASVVADPAATWLNDPFLLGQVQNTIELCRARRQALSLKLAQIDQFESLLFGGSMDDAYRIQQSLLTGFEQMMSGEGGKVVELGDDKFGFLLPGLDRIAANRLGQEVLRVVRHWSSNRQSSGKVGLTLSLGCASTDVPARNLRADSLVEAAARCLEHVQRASGNGLKSIDIYY
ncbi:MAG: HDOD domain-containing protein [Planctomycetaceae bacterium]|nr:HDOD domain-containing protein [Planctomycetaceae bacterium]